MTDRRRRLDPDRPLPHLMAQVLGAIRDNRHCSVREIARHLLLDESCARGAADRLSARGFAERMYTGQSGLIEYTISDEGEAAYQRAFSDD